MGIVMFDTTQEPDKSLVKTVPIGEYTAMLISSDVLVSKKNPENKYANMKWEIVSGEYAGVCLYFMLHYWNVNPKTKAWAKKYLREMCDAVGFVGLLTDTSELHSKLFNLHVTIETSEQYGDRNKIIGWSKVKSSVETPVDNTRTSTTPTVDPLQDMWGKPGQ